ncbi:MAG: efflux RND transporter permease subunit [Acidobacteriota bacterium]
MTINGIALRIWPTSHGTREMTVPILFSVLTTVAAFGPLLTLPGDVGQILRAIPLIVITTLIFSLIESLLILPAHLSGLGGRPVGGPADPRPGPWTRVQDRFSSLLETLATGYYRPALDLALRWRYATAAAAVAVLLITAGYLAGGHLKFLYLPPAESDSLVAFVALPPGTPAETTARALAHLEASADELREELRAEGDGETVLHVMATLGDQPFRTRQSVSASGVAPDFGGSHLGEVHLELAPADRRRQSATDLLQRWRRLTGPIPDATELTFNASALSTAKAIELRITGEDLEALAGAAAELKAELARYPGVHGIGDTLQLGKQEIELNLKREAGALGVTRADLARQVRQAFYGEEVQRIQRGRDDVKVMVRYPERERRSLDQLAAMQIRPPGGGAVPFAVVGEARLGRGYESIQRIDGRRSVTVMADVDGDVADPKGILADLEQRVLPDRRTRHPDLRYEVTGEQRDQQDTLAGLQRRFLLALFVIYMLIAIPFRSYFQPLIVLSAVPFGVVGAVWGHALTGEDLTTFSIWGIVAAIGVVVNDSLILVDCANRGRRRGQDLATAIRRAGELRLRPILLTSFTTFVGLAPLIFEGGIPAKLVAPMAISLAFGVLFATLVIPFLVPVAYCVLDDLGQLVRRRR